MKISVIVPVYKAEEYLCRCIDGILEQTYQDLEVILIDDGSPDRCPEICDEYAEKDSRIRVIHQKNAGVAAARNAGLDIVQGEYITFVDSDDYIDLEMYKAMIEIAMDYDCDVVMCDCVKEFPDYTEIYTHDIRAGYYDKQQLREEYFPHLLMMENVEYPPTISNCLCLFRNKKEEKFPRYLEGIRFSEDLLFGAQMMSQVNSFYYMKGKAYYHYYMNPQSATHIFCEDKWIDYLRLYAEAENYFLKYPDYDFRHQLDLMMLFFVYNAVGNINGAEQVERREKLWQIRKILENEDVRTMFQRISVMKLPISGKLKIITFVYKYRIGIGILVDYKKV